MKEFINNSKKSDTWKIQLTIAINFISSKDTDEERVMHLESDNIEIMIYNKAKEVIQELLESLFSRYQTGLEELMKGSDFIFDCINILPYKCHKTNLKRGESYIDSPALLKNKKPMINPTNDADKCLH